MRCDVCDVDSTFFGRQVLPGGIRTGNEFDVMAEPKGVPDDCTDEWKQKVEDWKSDMHSHSYLSVDEFDKFDWNQKTTKSGVIPLDEYKELRGSNKYPQSWSSFISGPDIITIDMDSADMILDGKTVVLDAYEPLGYLSKKSSEAEVVSLESGHRIYVLYEWDVLYSEWFDWKIESIIEPMRKLKEEYEDVRYVFGFDN